MELLLYTNRYAKKSVLLAAAAIVIFTGTLFLWISLYAQTSTCATPTIDTSRLSYEGNITINTTQEFDATVFYIIGSGFDVRSCLSAGASPYAVVRFYKITPTPLVVANEYRVGTILPDLEGDTLLRVWVKGIQPPITSGQYLVSVVTPFGESNDKVLYTFNLNIATPTPTPSLTCYPRPACLDAVPRCLLMEPIGGWCPAPSVSPSPLPGGFQCYGGGLPSSLPPYSSSCYATKEICEKECYSMLMQGTTNPVSYGQLCAQTSCKSYVTACTQEYAPVCGTDGRTYSNSCFAKAASVPIAYPGQCGACLDSLCDPLPTGCQYVKTSSISGGVYTSDYSYAGTAAYSAPTIVTDPCWCGTVMCPTPTPSAGGVPSPTPVPLPPPTPTPCTNAANFTSSCWQDGTRIINVTTPTVAQSNVSFTVVVKMPTTASGNAIWNRAHYYSNSQQRWVPVTMAGTKYPGYQFNAAGEGYVTGTAGSSLSVPLADALSGKIYVITWDYVYDGTAWKAPTSASCTDTRGCWRLEAVPAQ